MKLNTIPIPTKAAVSLGERLAMLANAPAETMGGMPDSNIDTRTASPSNPAILQINKAAIGAAINFIKSPIHSCEVTSLFSLSVS